MESLGERLKRGREEKNISLDDVAQATKINKGILSALENDQSEFFPPVVFVRGFIRNYARYVGLNEKELFDLYTKICSVKKAETMSEELKGRKKIKFSAFYMLIIIFLIGATFVGYNYLAKNYGVKKSGAGVNKKNTGEIVPIPSETQTGVPPSVVAAPLPAVEEAPSLEDQSSPAPLGSEDKTGSPSVAASPAFANPIRLKAKCYATTWIGYVIDNGQPSQIFLFPGDDFSWEWQQSLELKLGNAGGIKVTLNGVPLRPLGKAGEVLSIVFSRDTVALKGEEPQTLELWKEGVAQSHPQTSGDKQTP
jgi:cytoskeleton protein RodZ